MDNRKIKYNHKYYEEIYEFCDGYYYKTYPEHNDRYLKQCLYNLQEKADRGIITPQEWQLIYDNFKEYLD
jgi:hypothetical protein